MATIFYTCLRGGFCVGRVGRDDGAARVREQGSEQEEVGLRFMFLEAIMESARKCNFEGVEEVLAGMARRRTAGLSWSCCGIHSHWRC